MKYLTSSELVLVVTYIYIQNIKEISNDFHSHSPSITTHLCNELIAVFVTTKGTKISVFDNATGGKYS